MGIGFSKAIPQSSQGEEPFKFLQIANCHPVDRYIFPPQEEVIIMSHLDASEVVCRPYFWLFEVWRLATAKKEKRQGHVMTTKLANVEKNPTF